MKKFLLTFALLSSALGCSADRTEQPQVQRLGVTATFPLSVSSSGRYFVDAAGVPFRMQSDAAWLISTRSVASDVDSYLATRQSQGFNTFVLMNIVDTGYRTIGSFNEPANRNGDQPFTTPGDFSTPNPAYFAYIDSIIDKAAAHHMAVLFFYTYLGYTGGDQGWWTQVNQAQNTQAVCFAWGQYLGNRYKNRPNILWMTGGDYSPPAGEGLTRVHKILEGIRSAGATQLNSAQWAGPAMLSTDQAGFTFDPNPLVGDINWNFSYGYGFTFAGPTWDNGQNVWAYRTASGNPLPGIVGEPTYEDNSNGPPADRTSIREYTWWASLTALGGFAFGTEGIWDFRNDGIWSYANRVTSPGSLDAQQSINFFTGIPWYNLAPEGTGAGQLGRTLIVSGQGTGFSRSVAAATPDGTLLLAYVPSAGTSSVSIGIDLRSMAGPTRARWFNPTTGAYTDITGGSYALSNTVSNQTFTTVGNNGASASDWLLVADAASSGCASGAAGMGGASGSGGSSAGGASGVGSAGNPATGGASGAGNSGAGGSTGTNGSGGSTGTSSGGASSGGASSGGASSGGASSGGASSGGSAGSSSFVFGDPTVLPIADYGNGNLLVTQQAVLGRSGTLSSLSFYVTQVAGTLRLGVYDASGANGSPGKLVAQAAELTTLTTGWNTAKIATPVSLAAGTYWLAYLPSSSSLAFLRAGAGNCYYYSLAYGALPNQFSASATYIPDHWSFYGTLGP